MNLIPAVNPDPESIFFFIVSLILMIVPLVIGIFYAITGIKKLRDANSLEKN